MRYIVQIIPAIILIIIGKYYVSDELRPGFLGSGLIFFITFFFVEVVYDVYQNYGKLMLLLRCKYLALKKSYKEY